MTVPVPTLLTGSQSGTNATSYATASISAAAGDALLVFTQFIGGARTVVVTLTTGGTPFTVEAEDWWNTGADEMGCHTLILGSSYTGTLTITGSGGGNQCHWSVIKLDAGTFDPTNLIPQWNSNFNTTGGSFSASLASPVNSDSRTFCMAGHTVFEGTAEGPDMTQLSDSPGNSGGSPLGRGFEAAWRSDAFETTPILQGTSSSWGFLCVEVAGAVAGGTGYNDTVDIVIVSAQANNDTAERADVLDHLGISVQQNSDTAQRVDANNMVAVVVMQNSDAAQRTDILNHTGTSSQQNSDTATFADLPTTTGIVLYTVVDTTTGGFTDDVDVVIHGVVEVVDALAHAETLDHLAIAGYALVDSRALTEVLNHLGVVVLQQTDTTQRSDTVSPVLSTIVTATDTLTIQEAKEYVLVGLYSVVDVYVDSSVPPFVILIAGPFQHWSTLLKRTWLAAGPVDTISEEA